MAERRFAQLSDRQRVYLRHVFQHRKSQEIAFLEGVSARAVDKQIHLAKNLIGATSRHEAARLLAAHEAGVEPPYPPEILPSPSAFWPLSLPLPTKARPANHMTWRQVLAWGIAIAVATPVAVTAATMLIMALALLLGIDKK